MKVSAFGLEPGFPSPPKSWALEDQLLEEHFHKVWGRDFLICCAIWFIVSCDLDLRGKDQAHRWSKSEDAGPRLASRRKGRWMY